MPSFLIVEDHANLAEILANFLRMQKHLAVAAVVHSGEAALEQLHALVVELVLVDVALPGMSGIELVAALREQQPDLPCLMLSGHNGASDGRQAMDAGARGYVAKGSPPALLEALQRILDGENLSKQLHT